MTLTAALTNLRKKPADAPAFPVVLACGFTPLHLATFFEAYLQAAMPGHAVRVSGGLYGDLIGTVESLSESPAHAAAIAVEWQDLDPRLGFRNAAAWRPADVEDILSSVERSLRRLEGALHAIARVIRIAVSSPTLPLPPVFYSPPWLAAEPELHLFELLAETFRRVSALSNVSVLNSRKIDLLSPPGSRHDLKSDLFTGLPYTLTHADILAGALAGLIHPAAPMKGLITDLDDTLWKGILGDAGVENVAWDLDSHARIHGLYQQVLRALAGQGVLVGCATKNDPAIVETALARPDILLPRDTVFPVEAGWGAKSAAIAGILKTWNIGADSVVFVDDSPMELAEVQQAFPSMHCLRFPKDDYVAAAPFLADLRGRFGKAGITREDTIRRDSIRQGAELQRLAEAIASTPGAFRSASETFLMDMRARIVIDFETAPDDPRVLELVNKTNQFNLNGIRYTEAEWRAEIDGPGAFAASIAYEDRFGPLGKIAVVAGRRIGRTLHIPVWVMSCRAFARRIEHQCIRQLLDRFEVDSIEFRFVPTPRNGPLRDLFRAIAGDPVPQPFHLGRELFDSKCPALYHEVKILRPAGVSLG